MRALYEFLQHIGLQSADSIWFPLLVWSTIAALFFLVIRGLKRLNPLYQYHLRAATLASIPFGLLMYAVAQHARGLWLSSSKFDPAVFVVESPYSLVFYANGNSTVESINWLEPNFLVGLTTALLALVSFFLVIRLVAGYVGLCRLKNALSTSPLHTFEGFKNHALGHVLVSFQTHPHVPFTFGWRTPIIVLPTYIKNNPEKTRMAIQHELVHIKRGDYLLQLFLSVIEALFWFHPLIHLGTHEIETWREISCDQEVLNTSGISQKNYAAMLFELLPLNRGLGNFSVPMAVQKSTLQKRIETMQYHKLYQSSVKRSLVLLFALIIGITLPMACSDLQNNGSLSSEELESTSFQIDNFSVEINGLQIMENSGSGVHASSGHFAMFVNAGSFGVFKISPSQFDGALLAGEIDEKNMSFKINNLNVSVQSANNILDNFIKADVWVQHYPERVAGFTIATMPATRSLNDFLSKNTSTYIPTSEDLGDYFIVVEEMPQLIGGLASIQGKVLYPELAKRAGIEGRVTVQFIVNENGDVENPKVIRGIGGGCDEAAIAAVSQAIFTPGKQRGRAVRVQYSIPVVFRLQDSEFSSPPPPPVETSFSKINHDLPPPPPVSSITINSETSSLKENK